MNFLSWNFSLLKFIYSEKATKFCKIFTLLLSYVVPVKSKVKISQNFVAFSEYMNFISNFHIKMIKSVLYCLNSFKNSMRKICMYQIVHLFSSRDEK